ncbi:MAG TPA: hypothetical protein VMN83_27200 [Albitalea sp.]|nr:hypothetical protein [Albitalea sp.]HUG26205.1 hypothetical protein [Albitalea sp.]
MADAPTPSLASSLEATLRMRAHHGELVVVQLARLAQDARRDEGLADVVQQAGQRRLARGRRIQAELAGQGGHQSGHRHRVHVGVVAVGLQADHAEQQLRFVVQKAQQPVHRVLGHGQRHRLAAGGAVEHRDHLLRGRATKVRGRGERGRHRGLADQRRRVAGRHLAHAARASQCGVSLCRHPLRLASTCTGLRTVR